MAAPLPAAPKLITFDTYGTLIDWDSALRRYVADLLTRHDSHQDAASFHHTWYYEYALPALSGRFQIYRELLSTTLQAALAAIDVSIDDDEAAGIGDAMAAAEPFSDSVEALGVIRQHAPLATISNSQHDIIEHSVRKLGSPFTYVFTGEDVQSYKPNPELFELVLERGGAAPQDIVHVAQSQYVDLPQSVPMGMPTIWINRHHQTRQPHVPEPTLTLHDLTGLPPALGLADRSAQRDRDNERFSS
jgi:2-haloacid dehalogenase